MSCTFDAIATISVNPIPVVTVNNPVICQGNVATMTPVGADTYLWSDGSTGNTLAVSPSTNTTYTVTGTSLGCSADAVANVTITLLPVVIVNDVVICNGESATLTASGGATYDWQTGETGNSIVVSPTTSTTYTVGDNTPGCSGSTLSTVTVNLLPTVTINAETICVGESATLAASGANTYVWDDGSATNPLTVSPTTTTTYTVTGTDANGCVDTEVTTITVNPLPIVTTDNATVCQGVSATLTASGATNYTWSNGATGGTITDAPSATNIYTATGTDVNGCTSTGTGTITIIPTPIAEFDATPNPAIVSSPIINFIDESSNDVIYWHWDFGDGDTLLNTPNPIHTYPQVETTYDVTLIVKNSLCFNSIMHLIVIGPEYSFFIPNAFTPNGDGDNDFFSGKGKGITEYELLVYDRWGNFIFHTEDLDKGWDGTANDGNEIAQQDVYVWKVNLTDVFHKKHHFVGTVTLVRGD